MWIIASLQYPNNLLQWIVGYAEAMAMKEEKIFGNIGDTIDDFFGITSVRITVILEPTGTILDYYHIVNSNTFSQLRSAAEIKITKMGSEPKLIYKTDRNVPLKFAGRIGSFASVNIEGKQYQAVYVGAEETGLLSRENIFRTAGDRIEDLFGNRVIVPGVLPRTDTIMDGFYFVSQDFHVR